nr:uncharacterized protein LOC124495555 isoform X1 [Dermatophagoides farinae]
MYQWYSEQKPFRWPSFSLFSSLFVIVGVVILTNVVISIKSTPSSTTTSSLPVIDGKWQPLLNLNDDTIRQLFMPRLLDLNQVASKWNNVSEACRHDIRHALTDMFDVSPQNRKAWPFQMFDSWSKMPPSGMFRGTITDYGDYDQCLSIIEPIRSQYCLVDFSMPMPKSQPPPNHNFFHKTLGLLPETFPRRNESTIYEHLEKYSSIFYYTYVEMAICMPIVCNQDDLETILKDAEKIGLELKKLSCEYRHTERWRPNLPQFLAILMLFIVSVLSTVALVHDYIHGQKGK